jgi:hypothetical protein
MGNRSAENSANKLNLQSVPIEQVTVADVSLTVDLADGRSITVPLAWYPRLFHGRAQERNNWRLIGRGVGIHWSDLDEDLSVEGIILGRLSNESQNSLQRWLQGRQKD